MPKERSRLTMRNLLNYFLFIDTYYWIGYVKHYPLDKEGYFNIVDCKSDFDLLKTGEE